MTRNARSSCFGAFETWKQINHIFRASEQMLHSAQHSHINRKCSFLNINPGTAHPCRLGCSNVYQESFSCAPARPPSILDRVPALSGISNHRTARGCVSTSECGGENTHNEGAPSRQRAPEAHHPAYRKTRTNTTRAARGRDVLAQRMRFAM